MRSYVGTVVSALLVVAATTSSSTTHPSIVNRQSSIPTRPPQRCSTRTTPIRIADGLPIASTSRWRRGCRWRSSRTWRGACRPGGALAPLVSHESTCVGGEPTLEAYFFERVRPIVEAALPKGPSADWPLITLNLDFKTNEPEHHAAVWALLGKYEALADDGAAGRRCSDGGAATGRAAAGAHRLARRPAGDVPRRVPVGARLRVFGAIAGIARARVDAGGAATRDAGHQLPPLVEPSVARGRGGRPARRGRVDAGGRRAPGGVLSPTRTRMACGFGSTRSTASPASARAGPASYNFGSLDAAARRWRAAIDAKVDFIATDQYAEFARSRDADRNLRNSVDHNLQSAIRRFAD